MLGSILNKINFCLSWREKSSKPPPLLYIILKYTPAPRQPLSWPRRWSPSRWWRCSSPSLILRHPKNSSTAALTRAGCSRYSYLNLHLRRHPSTVQHCRISTSRKLQGCLVGNQVKWICIVQYRIGEQEPHIFGTLEPESLEKIRSRSLFKKNLRRSHKKCSSCTGS